MRLPLRRISILSLASALLFAGQGAAIAAELAPCEALTESDVRGVLGANWKRNEAFSKGEACVYQGSPAALVTIILTSDSAGAEAILAGRRQMAGDKATPAFGPGAGAYRVTTANAIALVFGKGEHVGQIEASPAATRDWAVLEKLATAAYGRLP